MGSKIFLLFGLLLVVLLISSEVAARELAETSTEKNNEVAKETNGEEEVNHPDQYGGYPGHGGYGGRGGSCRPYNRCVHGGKGCHYGCCYRHHGRCHRCCSYAGEAVQTETEAKPHD